MAGSDLEFTPGRLRFTLIACERTFSDGRLMIKTGHTQL